jgi:hypothetical protein
MMFIGLTYEEVAKIIKDMEIEYSKNMNGSTSQVNIKYYGHGLMTLRDFKKRLITFTKNKYDRN